MSASQYFFQVQIDYLAYYGRPADPAGQLFWATKIDQAGGDNTAVINAFASSPESLALFGPITSANIAQVVTLFYLRDFNRLPDAPGLAFYVNGFNNHTFTPATIALNIFNGATGDDAIALGNKIHVANIISQEIAGRTYNDPGYGNPDTFTTTYSGDGDANHARDFMQNVHSDAGSVPSDLLIKLFLQNIIANQGDSILLDGQSFVLTPFVDAGPDFEGGAADNKYFASGTTLTPGDNLDGGGGDNSFLYQSGDPNAGGPVHHSGFMTKNIQKFFLTADVDTTIDMSGTQDVVWVTDTNSAHNLTLTHGPEITKVLMTDTTAPHCLTIDYQALTVAGKADTQVLWLDGVLAGSKVKIDGIETMNVTTLNNDSSLWTIQSDALKTFNLDGTKSLTLDHLDFPGAGTLTSANKGDLTIGELDFGGAGTVDANNTGNLELDHVNFGVGSSSIDASGIGGTMFVELDNAASAGRKVAVTGSGQDDTLDVQNGFNSGDSANLGGGSDEMFINASNFSVDENAITNTEIADLLSGTLGTFDLDAFDTALNRVEINTNTAGTVDFLNVENDGSEFFIFDNDVANLDGKTVNFHAVDTDPIFHSTASTVNLEIDNINEDTSVTFGGFEDNSATLNTALFGDPDATFFMHLDPVTTLGLSGNVNIDVTSDAPTVTTVNGGTTTGNVNIEAGVLSNSGATVTLGSGEDTVIGGNGNDSIDIGTGGGSVDAGSGNDTVVAHGNGDVTFHGEDGNDSLVGANGDDKLVGGNGADTIIGGNGQNTLEGDGGADVLVGGADSDKLIGGLGSDTMTGGGGADVFHYDHVQESQGAFVDKITDFVSGTDKIDLIDALIDAAAPVTSMADVRFVGNVFGVAAALSALTGSGQVEIVYDTQNFMVYVDVNGDGTIDGTNDMVINMDPPATMQASDFGIPSGNVYTAAVNGFDTDNPADSFENTTTSSDPDIVNALGSQIPGSHIDGHGGGDTLNINTPLAAFDLGTVMDHQFINLNLNGTTGHVIGPDQTVSLHTFISSKGGDFETGTNLIGGISQFVDSGNGADTITLTNTNDSANTRGGNDVVHTVDGLTGTVTTGDGNDFVDVGGAFNGTVSTGAGTDEVEVRANAHFGTAALLDGGSTLLNNEGDELELFNGADVSGDTIRGFDHVTLGNSIFLFSSGNATMALSDYNGLLSGDKVRAPGPNDTMTLMFGGSATLDSSVENWFGDFRSGVSQVFTLGSNDMNVTLYDNGIGINADKIVNPFNRAHGTYTSVGGGSGDVFEQQVSADFQAGTDGVFSGFETLQLDNGADVTMTNSQHNSFNAIDGQNGPPFGTDTNTVDISNVFNGTTRDSVEVYNLNGNGATTYTVGGNNQTIFDNNTAGHTVNFNNNLNGVTLHTDGGADSITLGSGESNITITSDGGADTVSASFGGTNISITTDANDVVNLGGTHTGLSVNTGIDDDIVNMANGSNLSGNINVGTGTDTLNFGTGNYGGLTISGYHAGDFVNLTTVGTYTFNANTYNQVITPSDGAPVLAGAGAVDATTIHVSDASSSSTLGWVKFSNDAGLDEGKFGTLVMDSAGNDVVKFSEFNFSNVQQLNISAGGSDKVFINNDSFQTAKNDGYLQITGFTADDKLVLQEAGTAGGVDQLIVAANTALSVNNAGVVIVNNTAVPTGLLAPTDVSNNGAVENYLAGAIGNVGAINGFFAVAYGTDGNAYVYAVNDTAGTDLTPGANMDVELVGVLNSVAANTLGFTNFAAS